MIQLALLAAFVVCLIWPGAVPDPLGVGDQLAWSVICFCAAAPILVQAFAERQKLRTSLDWLVGAYLLFVFVSSVTSVDRQQTLLTVIALLGNVAIFYATTTTIGHKPRAAPVVLGIVVVGIAIVEIIALEFHLELGVLARPGVYPRPAGWSGYPELGLLAAVQFAILFALVQDSRSWWVRVATLVLLGVNLVELALLYSRLAWIAVVGVGGVAIALSIRARRVWRLISVGLLMLAIGTVLISQNATLRTLAGNLVGMEPQTVAATPGQRFTIWERTARMIRDHPWLGVGPGNFALVYEPHYNPHLNPDGRRGVHAHNLWLHQTAELGLPGGAAYLILWIAVLVVGWKRAPSSLVQQAAFYVVVAVAFRNLGDNMFYSLVDGSARLNTLTWIFFALCASPSAATGHP